MKFSLPFKISLFYAGCGGLWMLLADRTLAALSNPETSACLQRYHGWVFVLLTTLALWAFAHRQVAGRLRGEAAHRETERQLAAFAGAASDGFLLLDENLTILFANPAAEKMNRMGRPLVGMQLADLSPSAVSAGRIGQYRQTFLTGKPVNFEDVSVELPSGSHHLAISAFKTSEGIGLILRDITAQKHDATELKRQKTFLAKILESIQGGISVIDRDLSILMTNQVMQRWSTDCAPMVGRKCYESYPPDARACDPCPVQRCFQTGRSERQIKPAPAGLGAEWIEVFCYPIQDEASGEITGAVKFIRDISEQVKTERMLRNYEKMVMASNDHLAMVDRNYLFQAANPTLARFLDIPQEALIGESVPAIFGRSFFEKRLKADIDRCLNGEEIRHKAWFPSKTSDKHLMDIAFYPILERDGRVQGMAVIARDITDIKRLEEQFIEAQKLEAIGTLAGGIAHDFNNLLMGILGHTSILLATEDVAVAGAKHLKAIEECTRSASHLTHQLLGFARGGKYEVKTTDLAQLIQTESALFARTRREIRVETVCSPDLRPVEGDRNQIAQVLLNLFVNAWQAMPEGGSLHISADNVAVDAPRARACEVTPGAYVRVAVRDTGEGMSAETRQRIFEPFFTTRRRDRGTGLGLAAVYGIVRNHKGFITVSSLPGKGTTFEILLPAAVPTPAPPDAPPCQDAQIVGGRGNVLLVDDEEMIVTVGQAMLEKLGYSVQTALSGQEALSIYDREKEALDLVILDMIMPDAGGDETFDGLRAINPAVRVLLSSGFSLEGKASQIMARGCNGFIQKPFSLKVLSQKVREVMAA
ncbi:MAG: PAS domain-containing protein [Desulfobacterales bacterium]